MAITKQGDTLYLGVKIKMDNLPLDLTQVAKIEFIFGRVTKFYPEDTEIFDDSIVVKFNQEDTAKLTEIIKYQARVKLLDGQVKGTIIYQGAVNPSLSKETL